MFFQSGGRLLRRVRRIRKLEQNELAALMQTQNYNICRWESGERKIPSAQLIAILDLLQFSLTLVPLPTEVKQFSKNGTLFTLKPATLDRPIELQECRTGREILRLARAVRGVSQGQLAYLYKKDKLLVARLELGRRDRNRDIYYDRLLSVLAILGLSLAVKDLKVGNSPRQPKKPNRSTSTYLDHWQSERLPDFQKGVLG